MIVEIAKFEVRPEDVPAFVAATHVGERIFNEAEGCISMELRQCVEEPGSFRMIVLWRKIEDHIEVFRNSKGVQEWRAAIGPFLKQPGEILNFDEPVVSAGVQLPLDGAKTSGNK
jgi:quinol monooxygenase YgiN